jgi:hypothetical protein
MTHGRPTRIVAMLIGAATLFVLQQKLGVQLYLAIPAGIFAYFATLVSIGLLLGAQTKPK